MLMELPNGDFIKPSEVLSISISLTAAADCWCATVRHGESFDPSTECVFFPDEGDARSFARDLAGRASAAMVEEANRSIEKDTRREVDRHLDRVCVVASGLMAGDMGSMLPLRQAIDLAELHVEKLESRRKPA